ncbi:1d6b253a-10dc-48ac-b48f-266d3726a98e [Sclerotinia trifoliorum]|uniref:1d6b253a-10dc-48ac-b48f-266d3726a98e n=1 Tax=Sclerotinia trifoliorum TaxID=28548 RepID=A0A8H2ZS59_9HELO|nr:1d6b253a-10dc-48ac-b48f-266d3726a98e [Sclerotinia trifoliorum]
MRVRQEFEGERKFLGGCIHTGDEAHDPFSVNSCFICCRPLQHPSTANYQTRIEREEQMSRKESVLKVLDQLHLKEAGLRKLKENLEKERRKLSEDEARLNVKESELSAWENWLDPHCRHVFDSTSTFSQNPHSHRRAPNYGGGSHSDGHKSPQLFARPRFNSFKPPQLVFRHRPDSQNSTRRVLRATLPEQRPSHHRQYDGDDAPRHDGFHHSQPGHKTPEHHTNM